MKLKMLKIVFVILIVILLISLFPSIREFLNKQIAKLSLEDKEKEILGSVDIYNPRVEEIQKILKEAGFSPGPIDGKIGWRTRDAIKEFQKAKGLKVNGRVDSQAWLQLNREKEISANLQKKEEIVEPLFLPQPEESLKDIKSKEEILKIMGPQDKKIKERLPKDRTKQIQIALRKAGFYTGNIDGKIGPRTKKAIIAFQRSKGLKPDGIVGPKTWEELRKYLKE